MKALARVILFTIYAAMAAWVAYQFTPAKVKARKTGEKETLKARMRAAYEVEAEILKEREMKMWTDPITGIESIDEKSHKEAFMEGVAWGEA